MSESLSVGKAWLETACLDQSCAPPKKLWIRHCGNTSHLSQTMTILRWIAKCVLLLLQLCKAAPLRCSGECVLHISMFSFGITLSSTSYINIFLPVINLTDFKNINKWPLLLINLWYKHLVDSPSKAFGPKNLNCDLIFLNFPVLM